jgi:acylphosphatase
MKSYKCIVSGVVQGVYYRKSVSQNALKANFKGYVKNLSDGTVEAGVYCKEEQLNEFLNILQKGSPNSRVDDISVGLHDEQFVDFEIRY